MSNIELPPGVEREEPKADAPEQPSVTLTITFDESKRGIWCNGPIGYKPLCNLMIKRVRMMSLAAIPVEPGDPGKHVLSITWDRTNPDPVAAFTAKLSTSIKMTDLELEMFIDWLCDDGADGIKANAAMAAARAQQQGVQSATADMLKGMRGNGRMPSR